MLSLLDFLLTIARTTRDGIENFGQVGRKAEEQNDKNMASHDRVVDAKEKIVHSDGETDEAKKLRHTIVELKDKVAEFQDQLVELKDIVLHQTQCAKQRNARTTQTVAVRANKDVEVGGSNEGTKTFEARITEAFADHYVKEVAKQDEKLAGLIKSREDADDLARQQRENRNSNDTTYGIITQLIVQLSHDIEKKEIEIAGLVKKRDKAVIWARQPKNNMASTSAAEFVWKVMSDIEGSAETGDEALALARQQDVTRATPVNSEQVPRSMQYRQEDATTLVSIDTDQGPRANQTRHREPSAAIPIGAKQSPRRKRTRQQDASATNTKHSPQTNRIQKQEASLAISENTKRQSLRTKQSWQSDSTPATPVDAKQVPQMKRSRQQYATPATLASANGVPRTKRTRKQEAPPPTTPADVEPVPRTIWTGAQASQTIWTRPREKPPPATPFDAEKPRGRNLAADGAGRKSTGRHPAKFREATRTWTAARYAFSLLGDTFKNGDNPETTLLLGDVGDIGKVLAVAARRFDLAEGVLGLNTQTSHERLYYRSPLGGPEELQRFDGSLGGFLRDARRVLAAFRRELGLVLGDNRWGGGVELLVPPQRFLNHMNLAMGSSKFAEGFLVECRSAMTKHERKRSRQGSEQDSEQDSICRVYDV